MTAATPDDVGLAGRGDIAALRRLREHWFAMADDEASNPILPRDEILPQLELLAELAAAASGEAEDWIALLVVYQLRVESLGSHVEASRHFTQKAVESENIADADRWSRSEVEFNERLGHYRAKVGSIITHLLSDNDAEGAAMLVSALSLQSDRGDERALPLIQFIIDSVTPERASAISGAVRKLEGATTQ